MAFQTQLTTGDDAVQVPTSGQYVGDWRVFALDGNDTVIGYNGQDTFYGSNGHDRLNGLLGNDFLYGEQDDDWLWGDDGNDVLNGGAGMDDVIGGNGHDTLIGGGSASALSGADYLEGGSGNDLYYHDFAVAGITIIDDASGNQLANADLFQGENVPSALNVRFGTDRSTLYVFADGEWNGSGIDNGVIIRGALRNDGTDYVGTIETAYFNGGQYGGWSTLVHAAWDAII